MHPQRAPLGKQDGDLGLRPLTPRPNKQANEAPARGPSRLPETAARERPPGGASQRQTAANDGPAHLLDHANDGPQTARERPARFTDLATARPVLLDPRPARGQQDGAPPTAPWRPQTAPQNSQDIGLDRYEKP